MINITEKDLRDILQIEIGSKGVWTYDLEEGIVKRIKALTIPIVSLSLPTMVGVLSAAHKEADKDYEDHEPSNHIFRCGFLKGVNWYKKEIEVKR